MAEAPAAAPPRGSRVDRVIRAMAAVRDVQRPTFTACWYTVHMAAREEGVGVGVGVG